jgi:steroid delta-isomerase-like uncharacterized protein
MGTAEGTRVLDEWAAAWSAHDTEKLLSLYTEDCVYEDVAFSMVKHGKAALRALATGTFAAVPDFTVEVTARIVAETAGVMEWLLSGTHHGNLPGMPATGKRFSGVRGATIVELQGDKIRRSADYWDTATFMRQVGLLPAP